MHIEKSTLYEIVKEIWESMLNLTLSIPEGEGDAEPPETITATVQIIGTDMKAAVIFESPESLAGRIASIMLDLPLEEVSLDDMNDALGEMVNVFAGNFLTVFLDSSYRLSIPTTARGPIRYVDLNQKRAETVLVCESEHEPLMVKVLFEG